HQPYGGDTGASARRSGPEGRERLMRARSALLVWLATVPAPAPAPAAAQQPTDSRRQIESLQFPPLRFSPPMPKRVKLSSGVPVYLLPDKTLPILQVFVVSKAGVAHVPDSLWAARSPRPQRSPASHHSGSAGSRSASSVPRTC